MLLVLFAGAGFAMLGWLLVRIGGLQGYLLGGAFLVIGCAGVCVAITALWMRPTDLTLTADGWEFRNSIRPRKTFRRWDDVSGFSPFLVAHCWHVAYDDRTRKRAWVGQNAMLPDTYGLGADKLVALLTAWRARARLVSESSGDKLWLVRWR